MDRKRVAVELLKLAKELTAAPKFMDWQKKVESETDSEGYGVFKGGYTPYIVRFGNYLLKNAREWVVNAAQKIINEGKMDPRNIPFTLSGLGTLFQQTGQQALLAMGKKYTDERLWSTHNVIETLKEKGTPQEVKEAKRLTKLLIKFSALEELLSKEIRTVGDKIKYGEPLR